MLSFAAVVLPVASIPSPPFNRIGPLTMYGFMIALGVLAAVELARHRWAQRGGNPDDISVVALWAVPAGLIGARLYHVITDNQLYRGHWIDALKVNEGGLGIPGGIIAGVGVGLWVAYRRGMRLGPSLDAVAPALPLAQAIGRFGNWFNQELYGGPTDLPWGLQIDPEHRPAQYPNVETFHPTFLYESLWNVGVVLLLIWLDGKRVLRPGRIFALYLGGYFLGRLWVESVRIDTANTILGLRVNTWMSLVVLAGVLLVFALGGVRRRDGDSDDPYRDGHRWEPGHEADRNEGEGEGDEADEGEGEGQGDEGEGQGDGGDDGSPAGAVATAVDDGATGSDGDGDGSPDG